MNSVHTELPDARDSARVCEKEKRGCPEGQSWPGVSPRHDKDTHLSLAVNISIMLESSVEILKMHWDGHQIISAHVSPNDVK